MNNFFELHLIMASVVEIFVETVLDVQGLPSKDFVRDNKFCCDLLLDHPLMTPNIWFHNLWKFFFGTYAPKRAFVDFWKTTNANQTVTVESILKSTPFQLAAKIAPLYNDAQLKQTAEQIVTGLKSKSYIKEYVTRKLCQRFGVAFEQPMVHDNPLLLYVSFIKKQESPAVPRGKNPITNRYVCDLPELQTTPYDHVHDSISNDRHFLYKLINNPAICVDEGCSVPDDVLKALIKLLKVDGKRPIVFNMTPTNKLPDLGTYVFDTPPQFYQFLPSVFSSFICISNKRYPDVRPLSREKKHAIYYLRGWSVSDIVENIPNSTKNAYDRCITSIPTKLLNPPLKTYRIFDWFETEDVDLTLASNKTLVGFKSMQGLDQPTDGRPTRVDTYHPINKHKYYDIVIDKYNEIPKEKIYEYLVNGATIKEDKITLPNNIFSKMLFSQPMFEKAWRDHLRYSCPSGPSAGGPADPMNNTLLLHEFIISYIESRRGVALRPLKTGASNTIVLADTRETPYSVLSVLFALQNVQQERWSCKVFTSTAAQGYYKRHLDKYGVQVIVIPEADTTNFDIDVYNEIFKSPTTWDMIGGEKVLIIQDDGFLLRKGVENFLGFDYVGAPWIDAPANNYIKANINSNLVGNGGFSLRDVPKSKFITEKYADDEHKYKLFYENQVETAEDVYFVTAMVKEKYNIATTPQAVKFSAEQIIHPESLGLHKVWVYHPREHIEAFFANILSTA